MFVVGAVPLVDRGELVEDEAGVGDAGLDRSGGQLDFVVLGELGDGVGLHVAVGQFDDASVLNVVDRDHDVALASQGFAQAVASPRWPPRPWE